MMKQIKYVLTFAMVTAFIVSASAQTGNVSGKVTNTNNEPLPGATIAVKNTTKGDATDVDGNYEIRGIEAGEIILEASFVGYNTVERTITVPAGDNVTVDFVLKEMVTELEELVVVGYGSSRKRDINSSISSVSADEIVDAPIPSLQAGLQGRASGVQITQSNGMPGGKVTTRIRGTTSILASSEPLYVIDGIPMITGDFAEGWADGTSALSMLNPSDIESIEVLKDASAAAIYGARAANGVVLITTKSGDAGKTNFNFNYSYGVNQVTNTPEYLNGPEYLNYAKEAWANSGNDTTNNYQAFYENLPFGITREIADNTNTDWIDEMTRLGNVNQANLSASGGNEKTTFYVGGGLRDEQGIMIGNDYKRLSGKVNLDHQATDKIEFGTKLSLANEVNERVPTGWAGGLGTAQSRALPVMPVRDSTGNFFAPSSGTNPVAYDHAMDYAMNNIKALGNVYAKYHFFEWLNLRLEFGTNLYNQRETRYTGALVQSSGKAISMDRRVRIVDYTTNNTLNFNKSFGVHNITSMLGMSYQRFRQFESKIEGEDFPNPALKNPSSGGIERIDGFETEYRFLSYFGRINYNYSEKYYVDFSLRRDGSSRFGKNKRFTGVFPAVSLGWTVSEESFFNIAPISFFKLRGSYGIQGNSETSENLPYLGLWEAATYLSAPGLKAKQAPNPDLGWESTAQWDVGLDFRLFTGRVSGGFDYYVKNTTDLLFNQPLPRTTGFSNVTANTAKMKNNGIEFFLSTNNLNPSSGLQWKTDFNIAYNKNEVIDTDGKEIPGETFGNTFVAEGYPIGIRKLVRYDGIYQETDPLTKEVTDWVDPNNKDLGTTTKEITLQPGDEVFLNHWNETTNEFNFDRDWVYTGQSYPDYYGGIRNTFEYSGFDLNVFFTYSVGQDVYRDDGKFLIGGFDGNWNQLAAVKDAWSENNPDGTSHKLYWQPDNRNYNSTRYLEDASYLRLKTLTFGYTLPAAMTNRINLSKFRLYVSGINLWTLTDYTGWDPEVNRDSFGNITQGVTYLSPPQVTTYTMGIEMNF